MLCQIILSHRVVREISLPATQTSLFRLRVCVVFPSFQSSNYTCLSLAASETKKLQAAIPSPKTCEPPSLGYGGFKMKVALTDPNVL